MRDCLECGASWPEGTQTCPSDGSVLVAEGADPYLGQAVGSYVVTRCLGRGGMGAVYEAHHPTIGSRVAVKFLHRRYASDQGIVDRFFNEARAVNVIGHDNIVTVSDFDRMPDGSPYFIMEFLEGQPLSALVDTPQPLSVIGPIFLQVAEGLLAAHEKGIIHRDLKPDNIFLVTRGRRANFVKIVDFGIAKLQGGDAGMGQTRTGMVMGTAQYMSPEQAGGDTAKVCPASDVYSLGVILFQLATGRLPFDGNGFGEILVGHLVHAPPSPRSIEPSIPEAFEALILRCLEKKPEARYQTMEALYEALGEVLDGEGLSRDLPLVKGGARTDPQAPSQPIAFKPLSAPPRPLSTPQATRPLSTPQATQQLSDDTPGFTQQALPIIPLTPPGSSGTMVLETPSTMVLDSKARPPLTQPPRRRTPWPFIAVVTLGLVAAAGGAWWLVPERPTPQAATATIAPPPVVTPPSPPARVDVTLVTTPPGAQASIRQADEKHEVTTPATLSMLADRRARATLTLEGHETLEVRFTPTEAGEQRWALVPTAPPPPPPKQQTHQPPKTTRRTDLVKKQDPEPKKDATKKPPAIVGDGIVDVDF